MGYIGPTPAAVGVTSANITDGAIDNVDIASNAAIALSKTALTAGTGITLDTNTLNIDAAQGQITTVGALDAGSITSGFDSIDVGAGAITTTGALSIASMGTNWTNAGRTVADMGTVTTIDINGGTINGITPLVVVDGGTGASTLTDHGVLLGSGSGAVSATGAGTAGQVLTSGGASADPTFVDAAPATTQTHNFVADGAITAGAPVSLQADGKVAALQSPFTFPETFFTGSISTHTILYDTTNSKFLITYTYSGIIYAIVATVASGAITYGTPVACWSGYAASYCVCASIGSGRYAITFWTPGSSSPQYNVNSTVLTISGDSVIVGTNTVVLTDIQGYLADFSLTGTGTADEVVWAYTLRLPYPGNIYAHVGTASGTGTSATVTYGARSASMATIDSLSIKMSYDPPTGTVLISYGGSSAAVSPVVTAYEVRVLTISGAAGSRVLTLGTAVAWSTNGLPTALLYVNGKHVAPRGTEVTFITVTGTVPSFAVAGTLPSGTQAGMTYDTSLSKVVFPMSNGTTTLGTITGATIAFSTPVSGSPTVAFTSAHDPVSTRTVISSGVVGSYVLYDSSKTVYVSNARWTGFADAAIADGETGAVRLMGSVAGNQTGLTIGANYYVRGDGLLSTSSASAVLAGRALSATEIIVTEPPRYT